MHKTLLSSPPPRGRLLSPLQPKRILWTTEMGGPGSFSQTQVSSTCDLEDSDAPLSWLRSMAGRWATYLLRRPSSASPCHLQTLPKKASYFKPLQVPRPEQMKQMALGQEPGRFLRPIIVPKTHLSFKKFKAHNLSWFHFVLGYGLEEDKAKLQSLKSMDHDKSSAPSTLS